KYHPNGMSVAAKLVKKALGVRRQDNESGGKVMKVGHSLTDHQQLAVTDMEKDKRNIVAFAEEQNVIAFSGEMQPELGKLDSKENFYTEIPGVPIAKDGIRRKHHRHGVSARLSSWSRGCLGTESEGGPRLNEFHLHHLPSAPLLILKYDGDSTIGHRLYKETTKVEFVKMKGKGRLTQPTNSYQWETLATNLEEFNKYLFTNGYRLVETHKGTQRL
ncbi:hypothetical protein GIB67_006677, partial [Kingdonia uniflora]